MFTFNTHDIPKCMRFLFISLFFFFFFLRFADRKDWGGDEVDGSSRGRGFFFLSSWRAPVHNSHLVATSRKKERKKRENMKRVVRKEDDGGMNIIYVQHI